MNHNHVSKTQISKTLMPKIGEILEGKYPITYINYSQFRVTCKSKSFPDMGSVLELDDKLFKVTSLNFGENRFSAEFVGLKEQPLPEVVKEKDEVVSLID
jgi:hypothetical protein